MKKQINQDVSISSLVAISGLTSTIVIEVIRFFDTNPNLSALSMFSTISIIAVFIGLMSLSVEILNRTSVLQTLENEATESKLRNKEIVSLLNNLGLGVVKKIDQPKIWELEGKIIGWNPNWACELKPTNLELYNGVRKIHQNRILNPKVTSIEYIFLDDYNIHLDQDLRFGKDNFLAFLMDILNEYKDDAVLAKTFINQVEEKYIVWVVPPTVWTNSRKDVISNSIESYKNLIFISGSKNNAQNLILFINAKGFINNGTHQYYTELYRGNEITQELINFFSVVKNHLRFIGITGNKISWDGAKFVFISM